jgi:hypothetical protein
MVLTNLENLEKLVMLQRVRLTSTGAGSGGASAADIIDVTSGSIVHLLERFPAIARQLQSQTRQASLPLINPTDKEVLASLDALMANIPTELYKAGVTAKPVLTPSGRVKRTIDITQPTTFDSGPYPAELYRSDVVILAVYSTLSGLNNAEDVCAQHAPSKSLNSNGGVRAGQPPCVGCAAQLNVSHLPRISRCDDFAAGRGKPHSRLPGDDRQEQLGNHLRTVQRQRRDAVHQVSTRQYQDGIPRKESRDREQRRYCSNRV